MRNNERGITLIALIITIIVMLILVAVTINVALNGGIFEKAKNASTRMQEQTLYEVVLSSMEVTNSGSIDITKTAENAKNVLETDGKIVNIDNKNGAYIVITVDNQYLSTITHSRIISGEIEKITWADLGIKNVVINSIYLRDNEFDDFTYIEDSNGAAFRYHNTLGGVYEFASRN